MTSICFSSFSASPKQSSPHPSKNETISAWSALRRSKAARLERDGPKGIVHPIRGSSLWTHSSGVHTSSGATRGPTSAHALTSAPASTKTCANSIPLFPSRFCHTRCNGVKLLRSLLLASAPARRRALATFAERALCSGVPPKQSLLWMSAPACSKASTISCEHALCSGVAPCLFVWLTSAPPWIRTSTCLGLFSPWEVDAARWSGVSPSLFSPLIFAPASSSTSIVLPRQSEAARWSGVRPKPSVNCVSAPRVSKRLTRLA